MDGAAHPPVRLFTVGHGRLDQDGFGSLLTSAGVDLLVDVRRFPGSRTNEAVAKDALPGWLPSAGIGYRWEERLGGRRRLDGPPVDTWWQVTSFQAYAAWTRQPDFTAALAEVLAVAASTTTAVMCSESVWWRCHRRLIADVGVLLHGVDVRHLMHDGRLVEHVPAAGARVTSDGVVWNGALP